MTTRLKSLRITRVALVPKGANQEAHVVLYKQAETKREQGMDFSRSAFAYAPDGPATWKLRLVETPEGQPTAAQVGRAIAALRPAGFRGNRVVIPAEDLPDVKRTVLAAWHVTHPEAEAADIPTILKGHDMDDYAMPMTTDQKLHCREWYELWDAFTSSMYDFMQAMAHDPATYAPLMVESIRQFLDHAEAMLTMVGMVEKAHPLLAVCAEVCKQGAVMSAARLRRLEEAIATLQGILEEAMPMMEKRKGRHMVDKPTHDADQALTLTKRAETAEERATAAETQVKDLEADIAKRAMTPEQQEAAWLASLPDVIRKQYEADKLEKAELRKKLQAAEDRNAKQEYIAKAAGYKALPINPDDDWEVFKAIGGLEEKHRVRIEQLFKSAEELCATAKVFEAVGTGGGAGVGGSPAYAQLEVLAGELQKGTKMTKEQAIVKAMDARPDLARAHRTEREEARNGR